MSSAGNALRLLAAAGVFPAVGMQHIGRVAGTILQGCTEGRRLQSRSRGAEYTYFCDICVAIAK